MHAKKVVLDTNCLLASISRLSNAYPVWKGFQEGRYKLCVTNEILEEYEEVIARKASPEVAENVIRMIADSKHVEFIDTYFQWHLITTDPDDNKFVDCAIVANATFIVSNDRHFNSLKECDFPKIDVKRIEEFSKMLPSTSFF